ncbi:hypothetical protein INN71_01440 [Nocardioides sp. ChNu-153]|uniref:hypothetical protein n=1 Tax=unclassified Nocardioides TaxID=2615069 RepID=UPI0024057C9F|nr:MULTISPECIES: hypothetical protein [unclassified Nocardioides]MDF9714826.1 hypothetical protein [Nocardioides sp. ChNu-99]MDN7120048.1 hypothetical protein [Nocardioides sp. ChNu-153]
MNREYLVPVRTTRCGALVLRTARVDGVGRVGLAFSGRRALEAAMGTATPAVEMSLGALQAMLLPLGVEEVEVDPCLVAHVARPATVGPAVLSGA